MEPSSEPESSEKKSEPSMKPKDTGELRDSTLPEVNQLETDTTRKKSILKDPLQSTETSNILPRKSVEISRDNEVYESKEQSADGLNTAKKPEEPSTKPKMKEVSSEMSQKDSDNFFANFPQKSSSKFVIPDRKETPRSSFKDKSLVQKKSSVFNPFESFDQHVSLSIPKKAKRSTTTSSPKASIGDRRSADQRERLRQARTSSIRSGRQRSISVVELSKQDVAVCFFPEEPDWDDWGDDEEEEIEMEPDVISEIVGIPDTKEQFDLPPRERWYSRLEYIVALVSYSISFNNIYHFPALVYVYDGLAFLVPYTIFTIVLGYPLHFLESSLGQYSQTGPVKVWDAAPIARGVGWAMFSLCLVVGYYYNMYAAYSVIYFSRCFNAILPWQDCDEPIISTNYSCVPRMCRRNNNQYTPAEHYFFNHVLQIQSSEKVLMGGLGSMVWIQVLGFLLAWIIVYVAIIQSVRSIGKVVYVLVILPYFVLLTLLTAGLMLDGSSRGFMMLAGKNFKNILNIQVWRVAAEQVFFELGICQGTPMVYGSYCHHRNPTHIDSAIICLINYCTSILCAMVIFLVLGALATEIGAPVGNVITRGLGMVYIVYPEALSRVPGSCLWCVMFFLMLFSVAVGTQIAVMETVMTIIYDQFDNARPYRWLINLLVCTSLFVLGLILCTRNGFFLVHLLEMMPGTMPRLPIAVFMVGTIVLIYGISKYCEDVHFMIGYYPNGFLRLCFLIMPILLIGLTIPSWVLKDTLKANNIEYANDAIIVAWFIIYFILMWILLGILYWVAYCYHIGQLKYVWRSLNSWGPRIYQARVARTEFSSDNFASFNRPWSAKKSVRIEQDEELVTS